LNDKLTVGDRIISGKFPAVILLLLYEYYCDEFKVLNVFRKKNYILTFFFFR